MQIERIGPVLWRIPPDAKPGMRVPGLVYADDELMTAIQRDGSLEQVANAAALPGIVKASLAMPDIHQGYGLPVGGVVATDAANGVISPGGVGYDINCGVRLLRTALTRDEIAPVLPRLIDALAVAIPSGVGSKGRLRLSPAEMRRGPIAEGARWAVGQGLGDGDDLAWIESNGVLAGADPGAVSEKAYERGRGQLGTLGSGNHFLEVQAVEQVAAPDVAGVLGLAEGQVTVMIHTGSRGFGHQVCTDALALMQPAMRRYGITLPDRQLACVPCTSPEGRAYLGAMRAAANFAFANRQCLAHFTREVFEKVLGVSPRDLGLRLVYDLAHNIAKEEEHAVEG
ncbi:MAG: RtcB family protein, partial [Actinomycetota bacterium]